MTRQTTTTDTSLPKAIIYLRAARVLAGDAAQDISAQRDACRRQATKLGATVEMEYVERGCASQIKERPVLRRMLDELAASRDVRYVLIDTEDRLAQDPRTWCDIEDRIWAAGAEIVKVDWDDDPGLAGSPEMVATGTEEA